MRLSHVGERHLEGDGKGVRLPVSQSITRKVDIRLPGSSHGARPDHQIITMIKWIWTSRLSIQNSVSPTWRVTAKASGCQSPGAFPSTSSNGTWSGTRIYEPQSDGGRGVTRLGRRGGATSARGCTSTSAVLPPAGALTPRGKASGAGRIARLRLMLEVQGLGFRVQGSG